MYVLWLTPDKPDDISVGRKRLAAHLRNRGIDVTVRGTTPRTIFQTFRESENYDALIGTTRAGAIAGSVLQYRLGCPFIIDHIDPIAQFVETTSWLRAQPVRLLERLAFRASSYALYVYDEEQTRVCRRTPCMQTSLGVEYDRFATPDPDILSDVRTRLQERDSADNIAIYVGSLEPLYNIELMIASIKRLQGWSLLILGAGSLEEMVAQYAKHNREVVFPGTVPHEMVPAYLHEADVGVALVDDPHTLKLLEYGAAGLPPVTLFGRVEDRFGELVTYCDPDPQNIAAAIQRAAGRTNHEQLREYVSQFDWATVADDYEQVLGKVTQ